jgi:predicted AlkP superfamily phosphohydrolase/phosphomutase
VSVDSPPPSPGPKCRVLAIGLDAFEISFAQAMMAAGKLPRLKRVAERSARFRLRHAGKFTGLAWEHFSTGKSPADQHRWSAVTFDPTAYSVHQEGTRSAPLLADLGSRVVLFDVPYFDLAQAPGVVGLTNWGAHDPGTSEASCPADLAAEIRERFGAYAAPDWIYGFCWPSPEKTRAAGEALARAVRQRRDAARWLLAERAPDWELAIVAVSEPHSIIEPCWHGIDPTHPLHGLASAPFARDAIEAVYAAIDDLIGTLADAFPDARLVLFSMHGMGANTGDVPAMLLLPELLYRHAFHRPYARPGKWPLRLPDGTPLLDENDGDWDRVMRKMVPWPDEGGAIARFLHKLSGKPPSPERTKPGNIGWMPAARYASFWPGMPAFAFPAYYDGQVRLNVLGRETRGLVALGQYAAMRKEIVDLIAACRDPISGRPVLGAVELPDKAALEVGPTEADIYVSFAPHTVGLVHPELGTIGPYPYRRTGGHTGDWGFLYATGTGPAGDRGLADADDVAPTLVALNGDRPPADVTGTSLLPRLAAPSPT